MYTLYFQNSSPSCLHTCSTASLLIFHWISIIFLFYMVCTVIEHKKILLYSLLSPSPALNMQPFHSMIEKYSYKFSKVAAICFCSNDYPSDTSNLVISKTTEMTIVLTIILTTILTIILTIIFYLLLTFLNFTRCAIVCIFHSILSVYSIHMNVRQFLAIYFLFRYF